MKAVDLVLIGGLAITSGIGLLYAKTAFDDILGKNGNRIATCDNALGQTAIWKSVCDQTGGKRPSIFEYKK